MPRDPDTTIPSVLMPADFSQSDEKQSQKPHPIFKVILGCLVVLILVEVARLLKR
jgi:hypothetical protein